MKIKVCLHYNGKKQKGVHGKTQKNVLIFTKFTDVFVCETNLKQHIQGAVLIIKIITTLIQALHK